MQLEFSRFVESDLDAIADYIAQDNPHRAITFIQEIRARFHAIRHRPLPYQLRPDIGKEARMAAGICQEFLIPQLIPIPNQK